MRKGCPVLEIKLRDPEEKSGNGLSALVHPPCQKSLPRIQPALAVTSTCRGTVARWAGAGHGVHPHNDWPRAQCPSSPQLTTRLSSKGSEYGAKAGCGQILDGSSEDRLGSEDLVDEHLGGHPLILESFGCRQIWPGVHSLAYRWDLSGASGYIRKARRTPSLFPFQSCGI